MHWTIETDRGIITANGHEGRLFDSAPGSEISPRFAFWDDGSADRHAALQRLVDAASEQTIRIGESGGRPYYRERLAAFEDVDSLLVGLAPDGDRRGAVWAVVTGGRDETPSIERELYIWTLECVVLRRMQPGDDRESIEAEFTNEVI